MNTKLILKGVLFWVTAFSVVLFIGGLESLIEKHSFSAILFWVVINAALVYICYFKISLRELNKISGNYHLDKFFNGKV